jgi:N-acetyl-anhydromuramyl-L-alanine amidase AmpD
MLSALVAFLRRVPMAIEQDEDERHDDDAPDAVADLDVRDGWLEGHGVARDTSPKHSRSPRLERQGPAMAVTHCTSTLHGSAPALLKAIRKADGREASWHILIDEQGGIVQSIPFTRAAWHAGSASAAKVELGGLLVSVNSASVGVELVNAGEVRAVERVWSVKHQEWRPVPRELRAWPFGGSEKANRGPGPVVPVTQTVSVGKRLYHAYTMQQVEAWRRVMRALLEAYPALGHDVTLVEQDGKRRSLPGWRVGHVDVDPARKSDPEKHWRWPEP